MGMPRDGSPCIPWEVTLGKTVEDVLILLEHAFPPEPINMDRAFRDWGRTYADARAVKAHVHGRTWNTIEPWFIERHDDLFGFLGTEWLAALLPAGLAAMVAGASPHDSLLYGLAVVLRGPVPGGPPGLGRKRFNALLATLSVDQRRAVAVVLLYLIERQPDAGPTDGLRDALESCWSVWLAQ